MAVMSRAAIRQLARVTARGAVVMAAFALYAVIMYRLMTYTQDRRAQAALEQRLQRVERIEQLHRAGVAQ
jgi:hypothetical protein